MSLPRPRHLAPVESPGKSSREPRRRPVAEMLAEAIYRVVHEGRRGVPAKVLADRCGLRHTYLLDAANPDRDEVQFQARWIVPLTLASGDDSIIEYLAHAVGGVFYRLTETGALDAHTAKSLQEFGDYLHTVAMAGSDRRYTVDEAEACEREALEAIEAILAHVDYVRKSAGLPTRREEQER